MNPLQDWHLNWSIVFSLKDADFIYDIEVGQNDKDKGIDKESLICGEFGQFSAELSI